MFLSQRSVFTRRILLAALAATTFAGAGCAPKGPVDEHGRALERLAVTTSTGRHEFLVEIADDEPKRQQGLMYRQPLADDRGMLFQFEDVAERSFWMKNTPSSLDIVYVAPDGRIVSIASHTTPFSETPVPSYGAAKGVLEVRAGRMAEIGAKAGDRVEHPFFGG